jgi:hypothetical protein
MIYVEDSMGTLEYRPCSSFQNFLVNCVFIFAYDNNCLYWIENKLFYLLFIIMRALSDEVQFMGGGGELAVSYEVAAEQHLSEKPVRHDTTF